MKMTMQERKVAMQTIKTGMQKMKMTMQERKIAVQTL
jgi:hypothetical protein